jgi:4-hydroxythreonine-4-phosphate dehydrogenase
VLSSNYILTTNTNVLNRIRPHVAITSGEPAGIGPDLCAQLSQHVFDADITIIGDVKLIRQRSDSLGLKIPTPNIRSIPLPVPCKAGQLDRNNSAYVLETLRFAVTGCVEGRFDAMVTAPVHKGIINDAGFVFSGHTEFLAELTHTPQVVMMLVGGGMRVALATTHIPLTQVSASITRTSLASTIQILHRDLVEKFAITNPRIMVAGLNPHAGEGGYLGREEIEVISPVLDQLRQEGMRLIGPLPADTMFSQKNLRETDAFLAMYHDQGLSVLKHASFGEGVNVTLGLPIIRTSVDHGTALDLAGTGKADISSMLAAIHLAIDLARTKRPY